MSYRISELNIFPIKSLAGIAMDKAFAGERGFENDRRWMVVDENFQFITQRKYPKMGFLAVRIAPDGLEIFDKKETTDKIFIPYEASRERTTVTIWGDRCVAERYVSNEVSEWLSEKIGERCFLVYSPDSMKRKVDTRYSPLNVDTGFPDGFPYLLANTASLQDLNKRAGRRFEMTRFRPNIVVEGDEPFEEDGWKKIRIGEVVFHVVKPCSRCVITTIDPETGKKEAEPLKTLASFRKRNNNIYFAQNMVAENHGEIRVGDFLEVLETKS